MKLKLKIIKHSKFYASSLNAEKYKIKSLNIILERSIEDKWKYDSFSETI